MGLVKAVNVFQLPFHSYFMFSDSIIAIGCMQTESEFAKAYETGIHKTK